MAATRTEGLQGQQAVPLSGKHGQSLAGRDAVVLGLGLKLVILSAFADAPQLNSVDLFLHKWTILALATLGPRSKDDWYAPAFSPLSRQKSNSTTASAWTCSRTGCS
jgi:hypothetical protein